jgi:hypothetical protein
MQPHRPTHDNKAQQQEGFESGFEVLGRLVAEHRRAGRSATLDAWLKRVHERLASHLSPNAPAACRRDAAKIARGFAQAGEAVELVAAAQQRR